MTTWRRRVPSRQFQEVNYRAVSDQEHYASDDDPLIDSQLYNPEKVPWSALLFAAILSFGGALLLCLGFMLLVGYIDPKYVDRTWPLLVLGLVMFIPGVYHMRIALYAFLNRPGYSFEDIPSFD